MIDVRFFHHRKELSGVCRQRLDIAPLALGVNCVKRERRLAGSGQAGKNDQLVARQAQVQVLEVVRSRAANVYVFHEGSAVNAEQPANIRRRVSLAQRHVTSK